MPEVPSAEASAPWRKRHPVLSRALLYAACVAIGGGLVWLLLCRAEIDRQDRLVYLTQRLEGMDILLSQDPDGSLTLAELDKEFAAADLPPDLQQKALRVRAYAYLKARRTDKAFETLEEARALAVAERDLAAVAVERAQFETIAGKPSEALAILDGLSVSTDDPALYLWHAITKAQALAPSGRSAEVVPTLDAALEALPRPVVEGEPLYLGNTAWSARQAAYFATSSLTDVSVLDPGPRPWTRLLEIFPGDFEVAAQAAAHLARAGHTAEAASSWALARELDADRAAQMAEANPDLQGLTEK